MDDTTYVTATNATHNDPEESERRARLDALLPAVYRELRRLARRQLRNERDDHSLDSVALVTEAYLKLTAHGDARWENRAHFFAIAIRAMRCVLVDHARARLTEKRGAGATRVELDDVELIGDDRAEHLLAVDEALDRLARVSEDAARVVEYRYYGGLTLEEAAGALGLPLATTRRRWDFAKLWLRRELEPVG